MKRKVRVPVGMERWTDDTGQELIVHAKDKCGSSYCSIHKPSNSTMSLWKRHYRADRGLMERICEHGVGHPDPDHMRFLREEVGISSMHEFTHGCDGCCMNRRSNDTANA